MNRSDKPNVSLKRLGRQKLVVSNTLSKQLENEDARYSLSLRGILVYVSFLSLVIGVCCTLWRHLSTAFNGTYSVESGLLANGMIALTTGLIFVAVGIASCYPLGYIQYYRRVAGWAFVFGVFFFWPLLYVSAIFLAVIGVIDVDF